MHFEEVISGLTCGVASWSDWETTEKDHEEILSIRTPNMPRF